MAIDFSYIDHDILGDVADAIRFIEGSTAGIVPADYPQRIRALKHLMTGFVIDKLPYFEDFEGYTESTTAGATGVSPDCWELVHEDVAMSEATTPQVFCNSAIANSGSYSLRMVNRGVYAMPELSHGFEMKRLKLEMYLRQANAIYQLQVGVWEGDSAFVPVATINNSSTGVEFVEVDFSGYNGSGHRIAFRNVLASGYSYDYSYNNIDDIFITYNNNQN